MHNELWVPAEELQIFNSQITGNIEVVNAFFGNAFILPEHEQVRRELLKFKP